LISEVVSFLDSLKKNIGMGSGVGGGGILKKKPLLKSFGDFCSE